MGVLIEDKEFDGTQCGEYDPDTRTAYIDPTMSMEQRLCTLQHELIHAKHFDDGLGLLSREKEERLTRKETAFSLINPIEYMRTEDLYGGEPYAMAQELGITDHILFAGLQSNVADWYQMMDLFVMPSRFEGLPVVGIEAQAAGLGCVFSDAVPAEVLLSSHAIQIPLSASNADWAAGLQRMLHQPCDRSAGAELIRQAGYDINIAAARLQQQYLQLGGQA